MPRPSNPIAAASGAVVAFFGVLMTMIGLAGASEPSEIRWVMVVMALAGGAMVVGGIQMILAWKRAEREKEEDLRIMHSVQAPPPAPAIASPSSVVAAEGARAQQADEDARPVAAEPDEDAAEDDVPVYDEELNPPLPAPGEGPELLAVWTYDPGEWGTYTAGEMSYRASESLWTGGALVVVGTWIFKGEIGFWAAFANSAGFAIAIAFLQWLIARSAHQKNAAVPSGDVRITTHGVLLNGTYLVLNDRTNSVEKAELHSGTPSILAVTVGWSTRSGPAREVIRIPVPAGREDEAERVRRRLLAR